MSAVLLPPPQELLPAGPMRPLPVAFLRSLRTLFEILDDQRRGAVHLSEIDSRWGARRRGDREWSVDEEGDGGGGTLLSGVLAALRQVSAPYGGYLTFPRLVAGLRIALVRDDEGESRGCDSYPGSPSSRDLKHNSRQVEKEEVEVHHKPDTQKSSSQHRETEGKGVTRSRSINGCLAPSSRWHSHRCPNEPRRHTITNGIDYDTLKRMKDLEQERDSLLQGLEMVEKAREWYHQRLQESQDRQRHLGTGLSSKDSPTDPYSRHGCLLLARIQEVNLILSNLLSTPGKATDPPMNGFGSPTSPATQTAFHPQALCTLQENNHRLVKEVTEKRKRIAQLEREKAALCQQLQENQVHRPSSHKESTFI